MTAAASGATGATGTVGEVRNPTTDDTASEVFGPDRVAQLRARLEGGTLDLGELDAEDQRRLVETLEGLWGALARERASFEPLLGDCFGPCGRHWYRAARTGGPGRFRCDAAYAEMTDAEVAVLTCASELSGSLSSFPEPDEWAGPDQEQ